MKTQTPSLNANWTDYQAGDIVLVRGNSLMGRLIRWCEHIQTGEARVNHAALVMPLMTGKPWCVIESMTTIRQTPISHYIDTPIIVYRNVTLSAQDRLSVCLKAASQDDHLYAPLKIPLFMLDCFFRTYWFTSHLGLSSWKVCSEFLGWSYEKALPRPIFGVGWRSISPDYIDDWCRAHPDVWRVVHDSVGAG